MNVPPAALQEHLTAFDRCAARLLPSEPERRVGGGEARSAAARPRPALVVKIDNGPRARPQAGINQADIVYEEQVEGGVTRLAAVFDSEDPASVGPGRSARSTDIGAGNFPSRYHREGSRPVPVNLFSSTSKARAPRRT